MCQKDGFEKDWKEKKMLADFQKCTEMVNSHTASQFLSLSFLFSLLPFLCGLLIGKTRKPKDKQLIIYSIRNRHPLCNQGILHTHIQKHTHVCADTGCSEEEASARKLWRRETLVSTSLLHCFQFAYVTLLLIIWPALQTWDDGRCFLSGTFGSERFSYRKGDCVFLSNR